MATIWLRATYPMEYVPKGARKSRRELVGEMVPVAVAETAEPVVAARRGGEPILWAHDGALYAHMRSLTMHRPLGVPALEAELRAGDDGLLDWHWHTRRALDREGFSLDGRAPLRETLAFRQVIHDGRPDGLACAAAMGGDLLVAGGVVMRRTDRVPMLKASARRPGPVLSCKKWPAFDDLDDAIAWRSFRHDEIDRATAYARHCAETLGYGNELTVESLSAESEAEWTEAGASAMDTDCWWLTRVSVELVQRCLFSVYALHAEGRVIEVCAKLRSAIGPYDGYAPTAGEAQRKAAAILPVLRELREVSGSRTYEKLAKPLDWVIRQAEAIPALNPEPCAEDAQAMASLSL